MDNLKKTPLFAEHVALKAKIVEYAGYSMPLEYASIASEHNAVRTKAGIFDVSHMGEVMIEGIDATRFMERLFSADVASSRDYRVTYGFMLAKDGGIIDDMLVYKYSPSKYFLVFNASNAEKDFNHISQVATNFNIKIEDLRVSCAEVAVQGPLAYEAVQKLVKEELKEMKFLDFKEVKIFNETVIVSRTGYTGEDGFEIYGSGKVIKKIWKELLKNENVSPCGLGCRDTLRFEASLPLYGHEIDSNITPLEAGFNFAVKFNHDFIGKEALLKQKEAGVTRKLVGVELIERGIPRQGYKLFKDNQEIGYITTGYLAPTVNKPIAMALVATPYANIGLEVEVEIRGKRIKAVVRDKNFYTKTYVK